MFQEPATSSNPEGLRDATFEQELEDEPDHYDHGKPITFVPASNNSKLVIVPEPATTEAPGPENPVNNKDKPSKKIQVVHVRGPRKSAKRIKENADAIATGPVPTATPALAIPGGLQAPHAQVPPGWMLVPAQGMQPTMMPAMPTGHQWTGHGQVQPVFVAPSSSFLGAPPMHGPMPNFIMLGQQGNSGHFAQPPVQYVPQQMRRMPEHLMFSPNPGQYILMG